MDESNRMTFRNGKRFRVSVNFPEISASHSYQDAEASGGNMRVAVNRALQLRAPPRQRSSHYIRDDKNHQARRTTASGARERFIKEKRCELSNSSVS